MGQSAAVNPDASRGQSAASAAMSTISAGMPIHPRRQTRKIWVGSVDIGGDAPIRVQSMTKTPTHNVEATVMQIHGLQEAGCEIIRVAVPDEKAAQSLGAIRKKIAIPLIADIHFNYRYALIALEQGVDGLRLNPGNLRDPEKIKKVVMAAKERGVPIRVGVNEGSLDPDLLMKHGGPTAEAMVESAVKEISLLEEQGHRLIKVSLKSTDVRKTIRAYELLASKVDYPFHIGITEAGTLWSATIKSSVGIGALLAMGIGDTLRVSIADDPVHEVKVGFEILKSLELRECGPRLIVCPTCGRLDINLFSLAKEVEELIKDVRKPIQIAVMGCEVNGPGEARMADIGIAGGGGVGLIFRQGKVVRKVKEEDLLNAFKEELARLLPESSARLGSQESPARNGAG